MTDWTTMRFNLRYHWKTVLIGGLALVGASVAWASIEQPDCRWNWDEEWYHHRTTVGQIRWCLAGNHVDINQQDEAGRTLLHRIALDLHDQSARESFWNTDYTLRYEGNTWYDRLDIVKEILRWKETRNLDMDLLDHDGQTVFQYAVRKGKSWQMAALLLKAGAAVTLSPSTQERAEAHALPLAQAFGERFKNPFDGEVNFEQFFQCQSFDCLLDEALKD